MTTQTRQDEIQVIHKEYKWFYPFIGGLIILTIGIFIGLNLFPDNQMDYSINLYTEIISVIITLVILDRINEYRETQRLKKRLIREAGSQSNETAKAAIDWLRHEGWLIGENSLLNGADLSNANLKDAHLWSADMEKASLFHVNLEGADVTTANLRNTMLIEANLKGANFIGSNLEGATLCGANLKGAHLFGAYLDNIIWECPIFGVATLPDGRVWTSDLNLARYTDTNHDEFQEALESAIIIRQKQGLKPIAYP